MDMKKGHSHPAAKGSALAPTSTAVVTSDAEKEPAGDDLNLRKQQEETAIALEEESAKLTKKATHFEETNQELEIKKANLEEPEATQNFARGFFKDEIAKLKFVGAEKESVESQLKTAGAALRRATSELDYVLKEMDETKKASEQVISERDAYQAQLDDKKVDKEAINGELERLQLKLDSLDAEKKRLLFELETLHLLFSEAFEAWNSNLELMAQERAAAAGMHGMDLSALSSEMHRLLSSESKLQEQHKESTKLNVQMQPAVEYSQRDLQLHVEEATNCLKLQIEELTKNNEDTTRELELVKAQFNDLVVDSDKKETKIDSMEAEKSKLERELADAKLALSEMEGQARTAKLNLDKALSLLRSTTRELELVKAQFNDLVVDSDKKETKIGSMEAENSRLERELADAKLALSEMEGQAMTAKLSFDKALSLLRSTSEFVCSLEGGERSVVLVGAEGERGVVLEGAAEEQELEADVQEFAKDLKAIRSVFENGATEKADMTRQLNLLQEAVVKAKNKSRTWVWIGVTFAVLLIFVVASLSYATFINVT